MMSLKEPNIDRNKFTVVQAIDFSDDDSFVPLKMDEVHVQLFRHFRLGAMKIDDNFVRAPEDQFLAQHPGPVCVSIAKIKVDEGTTLGVGQSVVLLEINVQQLSETVGTLKHMIAREFHVPANKQKLISAKAGVLKDNLSLAYYNVGGADHVLFLFVTEP